MQIGFGRQEITPRVGVELCGFGPYLHRYSIGVRDRLWARAMAVRVGETTVVVVSCDLIGVNLDTTRRVRAIVEGETGVPPEAVMVHCTHTHSGPSTDCTTGWGAPDEPYLEVLPQRIAAACVQAVGDLAEGTLSHAQAPCEGIGLNREQDRDAPPLEEVLRDDWRPAKPELTDTTCHVLKVEREGRLAGFASSFGCHPVTCCQQTRYLHGDFVGVATNLLEREHPGSTGLFLQGAQGDINSCVVHKPEAESLLALEVIAGRYANAVRAGLAKAQPVAVESVACARREVTFDRLPMDIGELRKWLAEKEALLHARGADDHDGEVRMATVYASTLRGLIERLESGQAVAGPTELQALRIGPVTLLGTPFEVFHAIKEEIAAKARSPIAILLGLTNASDGYAPDRETAARGGYAAQQVPIMKGSLPYRDIHGQLVEEVLRVEREVGGGRLQT